MVPLYDPKTGRLKTDLNLEDGATIKSILRFKWMMDNFTSSLRNVEEGRLYVLCCPALDLH